MGALLAIAHGSDSGQLPDAAGLREGPVGRERPYRDRAVPIVADDQPLPGRIDGEVAREIPVRVRSLSFA